MNGASSLHVPRHVVQEYILGTGNVTIHHLHMEEHIVQDHPVNPRAVISSHVLWMEDGVYGAISQHVPRHVVQEYNIDTENVIIQSLSMEDYNVLGRLIQLKSATLIHAYVI